MSWNEFSYASNNKSTQYVWARDHPMDLISLGADSGLVLSALSSSFQYVWPPADVKSFYFHIFWLFYWQKHFINEHVGSFLRSPSSFFHYILASIVIQSLYFYISDYFIDKIFQGSTCGLIWIRSFLRISPEILFKFCQVCWYLVL